MLLPRQNAPRTSFLSEVTTPTSMDAATVVTTTTTPSSSSVEMLLIQLLVVALTVFIYHQSTHQLTLPFKEGEKAVRKTIPHNPTKTIIIAPPLWTWFTVVSLILTTTTTTTMFSITTRIVFTFPVVDFRGFGLLWVVFRHWYREKFVCYSAWCLGVVATVLQRIQQKQRQQHDLEKQYF